MAKKSYEISAFESEMIKPKELIQIKGSGPLTLQDRRTFNLLLDNAWGKKIVQHGEEFEITTISLKDAEQNNQRLRLSLRRLMTTLIVVKKETGDEVVTQLLGSVRIKKSGMLRYSFPNELSEVLEDSSVFAKLDIEVMKSFRSKYAFALYEAIARRIRLSHIHNENLSIEEVRELLGVDAGKLTNYRNLRMKAIEPAIEEVNSITPFNVQLLPVKSGRKVTGFKMFWHQKTVDEQKEAYAKRQKHTINRQSDSTETIVED